MELLNDNNVKEQFHKLIIKFITKKDNYNTGDFIGGLPITLENKDVFSILAKDKTKSSKYSVTQKVDGTRMLMYIGYNTSTGKDKQRIVCFIDRNMKIYTLRDSTRAILPYLNTREMLLDGEIVFFDKDNIPHKELQSRYVKGISFMCFDILFGPENISVDSEGNKKIGQEFSFTVPFDGILKTYPWNYINRYDILHKLIIPSEFNKNEPILTEAFKDTNWFNVELKPIYFLDSLKKDYKNLYTENDTGFLQKDFVKTRKNFYNNVLSKYGKQVNTYISKPVKLDGLIFTSYETLYTIGPWNKFGKEQFKWKPVNLQTVDLLIKKIYGQTDIANVLISKGPDLVPYQIKYKPAVIKLPDPRIKDNSIAEFGFDKDLNLVFKEIRPDKKNPNSLRTITNVINSFRNPVDINDLHLLLNIETLNKTNLKKIMRYVPRPKLLNCVASHKSLEYLNEYDKKNISDMFSNVSEENELEIRIGTIKDSFFDTNIDADKFEQFKSQLETLNYKIDKIDMVDIIENDVRTRYFFQEDFGNYIYLESVVKKKIKNIDINSKKFSNFDSRISLSQEIKVKQYSIEGNALRKFRISYTHPKELFRVDMTTIIKGKLKDKLFIEEEFTKYNRQIEIEILKPTVNINELFNFIYSF